MVDSSRPLDLRTLVRLFIPLSLSDMMMVLAGPVISAGLSRLDEPTLNLAAYGAAMGMALLIESPVIMLLHAATAAARQGPVAFGLLRRILYGLCIVETVVFALVALTPAYFFVFRTALSLPEPVVQAVRPAFAMMLFWPAAIAWRRYHQGYLIYCGRSRAIFFGTLWRLATVAVVMAVGVALRGRGAVVATAALHTSVIIEALVITYYYWLERRRETAAMATAALEVAATAPGRALTHASGVAESTQTAAQPAPGAVPEQLWPLLFWFLPLAATSFLIWASRPMLSAGIARANLAAVSLAVWPVAWNTVALLGSGTRMVQQLAISLIRDRATYQVIYRFSWLIGGTFALGLAAVAFTPLGPAYLGQVIGLPAELLAPALPVLQLCAIYPVLVAQQAWYQSLLVRAGRTAAINGAAFAGGVLALALVLAGARYTTITGAYLAALAVSAGMLVELALLWRSSAAARRRWQEAQAAAPGSG